MMYSVRVLLWFCLVMTHLFPVLLFGWRVFRIDQFSLEPAVLLPWLAYEAFLVRGREGGLVRDLRYTQ